MTVNKMAVTKDNLTQIIWEIPHNQKMIVVEELPSLKKKLFYTFFKRLFDITVSFLALVVLLIPMAIITLIIALDSPGNPIYVQLRLGLNQKPFLIFKFRTMRVDAETDGLRWAEDNDPRVTKIGRFLRHTRLDELPQLVNIFLGQMSFVGPRPERPEFYDLFDTYISGYRQRMLVKPGLTGLAQVNGGYDLLPEEKIIFDIDYIKNRSILLDLKCFFKTVRVVLTGKGTR